MPDFHILTGPPGSGKTTVLQHLAGPCLTVAESARRVLAQQRRVDGQGTGDRDPALFVALMLEQAVRDHDAALSAPGPVIFDRGLPDLLAYAAYWQLDTAPMDRAIAARGRARNVFWFPAWQAIYASDDERTLDFAGTEAFGALTRKAYKGLGYTLIDMPLTDAATRAAFIRDRIDA